MSRLALLLFVLLTVAGPGIAAELPSATHYDLSIRLFPADGRLEARAAITVTNSTAENVARVPFLLYRLLEVSAVRDANGHPLRFDSSVVKDADDPSLQIHRVDVALPEPLAPGGSAKIEMEFSGPIHGYPEVWAYVRESIGEDYTLLRDDSFAYPILGEPNASSRHAERRFGYRLEVTAPKGYTVAAGGHLIESRGDAESVTFVYEDKVPVWRLDIAVARFSLQQSESGIYSVYVLPGHEEGGRRILEAMEQTVDLYTRLFGSVGDFKGFTAIEIPGGWGSQAADLYFLQTAAAFEDPARVSEVYHEVAHNWNAHACCVVQRSRYFDEAFASYFETLALRDLREPAFRHQEMERSREIFNRRASQDPKNHDTPIADYGKHGLGGLSYTKGAWSLYVLHELVGEQAFRAIVRRLLADFRDKPVDFAEFRQIAEQVSGRKLDRFFAEWIFGAESSRLLSENLQLAQIVKRYR